MLCEWKLHGERLMSGLVATVNGLLTCGTLRKQAGYKSTKLQGLLIEPGSAKSGTCACVCRVIAHFPLFWALGAVASVSFFACQAIHQLAE